ncbi:KTSC domain-containing protein [bacterium]|nr:MAG: KTSC domain-containing protein [bacterium]
MNRTPVVSSNLASVGYDAGSMTLEVEFRSGSVYQYFDVPAVEFEQLLSAASVGQYFCRFIRDCYRYVQL